MSRLKAANKAQTTLLYLMDATATSFTVASGGGDILPAAPARVTIGNEIVEYGVKTGDVCSSVLRGQEGTVAAAHQAGAIVENKMTAGMYEELVASSGVLATILAGLSVATNAVITATDTILGALGKLQDRKSVV